MSSLPPLDDELTRMPGRAGDRAGENKPAPGDSARASGGSNTLVPGTRLGEFEITGLIGEGGFGIVYLAYDHSFDCTIALKEYMPSALAARTGLLTVAVKSQRHAETFQAGLKSFVNEARLLRRFDHPSLVKVYRFWEANGTAYMVMPFYEGPTLKEALKKLGGPPDEAWLKNLLRPLTDALAILHRDKCFHRDIAPDNILILNDGRPLLLDFGAARRVIGDMTQALTVILKPGYAPIEQYAEVSSMKQGAWTDIYALGAVVYYAIVGKAPVPSVARLMSDPLEPLSVTAAGRYSESFLKGIEKSLAVRPEDRPQDVAELRQLVGLAADRRQSPRTAVPPSALAEHAASADGPTQPGAADDATRLPQARLGAAKASGAPASLAPTDRTSTTDRKSTAADASKKPPIAVFAIGAVFVLAISGAAYFLMRKDSATSQRAAVQAPAALPGIPAIPADRAPKSPAPEKSGEPPVSAPVEKPQFTPGLMLDQVFEGRDRQHAVTASVDRAQVRIGRDHLRFNVGSSKPGHVYVFVVGTNHSDFYLLFPNSVDKNNRIAAGATLTRPGPRWPMKAQGPAGTDQFLAIVSDEPRDFSGLGGKPDDVFIKFPPDTTAQLYAAYSGAAPLFAGKVVCFAAGNCSQSYGAAFFSIEEVGGAANP